MTPQFTKDQLGNKGFDTISDTTARTNLNYRVIQIVSDAVFTTLASATGFSGITYPAGMILRGNFTSITLASGTINCYAE
jgi:hypothetical protein